jgi:hypothetical protein
MIFLLCVLVLFIQADAKVDNFGQTMVVTATLKRDAHLPPPVVDTPKPGNYCAFVNPETE